MNYGPDCEAAVARVLLVFSSFEFSTEAKGGGVAVWAVTAVVSFVVVAASDI